MSKEITRYMAQPSFREAAGDTALKAGAGAAGVFTLAALLPGDGLIWTVAMLGTGVYLKFFKKD